MKEYDIINISDIHLGHPRNPTNLMLENMSNIIYENIKLFKSVTMIVFSGDIFHRLLSYSEPDIVLINEWFINFYKFAEKNNIMVRMLKGTPSHDYDQIDSIVSIIPKDSTIDFLYFNEISIEYNHRFETNILYVPDQCSTPKSIVMEHIHKVMLESGVSHVGWAVMHGAFDYQIPFNLESSYDIADFDFVDYYIMIGHHHTHKPNKKVIPAGSFDRTSFGEMEKKGIVHITYNPHTGHRFKFIENKKAMLFDTITLQLDDLDKNKKIVLAHIAKRPCRQLMIKITSPDIDYKEIAKLLKDRGVKPTINKVFEKDDKKEEVVLLEVNEIHDINESNISALLGDIVDIPNELKSTYKEELSGIINTYIL